MNRVRVAITTASDEEHARVTTTDRLQELLMALERFGPEPEGIIVEIDEAAIDELPPAWEWLMIDNAGEPITAGDEELEELDPGDEALIERFLERGNISEETAEQMRLEKRLKDTYTFTPEFWIELPEPVAEYIRDAARSNLEAAPESEYFDEDAPIAKHMEDLLMDFLHIRPRWVFPDGTVIGPGVDDEE